MAALATTNNSAIRQEIPEFLKKIDEKGFISELFKVHTFDEKELESDKEFYTEMFGKYIKNQSKNNNKKEKSREIRVILSNQDTELSRLSKQFLKTIVMLSEHGYVTHKLVDKKEDAVKALKEKAPVGELFGYFIVGHGNSREQHVALVTEESKEKKKEESKEKKKDQHLTATLISENYNKKSKFAIFRSCSTAKPEFKDGEISSLCQQVAMKTHMVVTGARHTIVGSDTITPCYNKAKDVITAKIKSIYSRDNNSAEHVFYPSDCAKKGSSDDILKEAMRQAKILEKNAVTREMCTQKLRQKRTELKRLDNPSEDDEKMSQGDMSAAKKKIKDHMRSFSLVSQEAHKIESEAESSLLKLINYSHISAEELLIFFNQLREKGNSPALTAICIYFTRKSALAEALIKSKNFTREEKIELASRLSLMDATTTSMKEGPSKWPDIWNVLRLHLLLAESTKEGVKKTFETLKYGFKNGDRYVRGSEQFIKYSLSKILNYYRECNPDKKEEKFLKRLKKKVEKQLKEDSSDRFAQTLQKELQKIKIEN